MIVIGGGVGPMAGVLLHQKIIENTHTNGTDQDHLEVLHLSRSPLVGDRTDYLQGKDVPDPARGMFQVMRMAAGAIAAEGAHLPNGGQPDGNSAGAGAGARTIASAVAGIPCNTFHAPRIFRTFLRLVEEAKLPIRIVNMVDETITAVADLVSAGGNVGLMSTTGTRQAGIYKDALERRGFTVLEVPEEEQPLLHESIYNREWGLKAVSPPDRRAVERVTGYTRTLIDRGAEVIILGCTELPLAIPDATVGGVPAVDPMKVLARALIREEAPEKLAP